MYGAIGYLKHRMQKLYRLSFLQLWALQVMLCAPMILYYRTQRREIKKIINKEAFFMKTNCIKVTAVLFLVLIVVSMLSAIPVSAFSELIFEKYGFEYIILEP